MEIGKLTYLLTKGDILMDSRFGSRYESWHVGITTDPRDVECSPVWTAFKSENDAWKFGHAKTLEGALAEVYNVISIINTGVNTGKQTVDNKWIHAYDIVPPGYEPKRNPVDINELLKEGEEEEG